MQELPFDGESFEVGEDYLILHVRQLFDLHGRICGAAG